MAASYDHAAYGAKRDAPRERSVAEHIFIWIGWALAAAFWGATFTTVTGIFRAVATPTPGVVGGADFGGVGYLVLGFVGVVLILGFAMAGVSWMFARRNRGLAPLADAKTAALYENADRQIAEGETRPSPDLARPGRETR